jgi:hypothetical protein
MRAQAAARGRGEPDVGAALMDAVDAIADMAQRVQLNGPELTYASEKLTFALYKCAEALALCAASSSKRPSPKFIAATATGSM